MQRSGPPALLHPVLGQGDFGKIDGLGIEGCHGTRVVVVIELFQLTAGQVMYLTSSTFKSSFKKHDGDNNNNNNNGSDSNLVVGFLVEQECYPLVAF